MPRRVLMTRYSNEPTAGVRQTRESLGAFLQGVSWTVRGLAVAAEARPLTESGIGAHG